MFGKILCANDGSEHAFRALALAITIAKENNSELHMVSVEEIDYLPVLIEDIKQETEKAARRFHAVLQQARSMAEKESVKLETHILAGHPVRDIVDLAANLEIDLVVIGSKGRSQLYKLLIGSRVDQIVHLAHCPVLVVR
jgi:nucleotide-binding universal stress UspA family protein